MEIINTTYSLTSGNRQLTVTKSDNSVDIRITKYARKSDTYITDSETIEEDLNIPVSLDAYYKFVNEMSKSC